MYTFKAGCNLPSGTDWMLSSSYLHTALHPLALPYGAIVGESEYEKRAAASNFTLSKLLRLSIINVVQKTISSGCPILMGYHGVRLSDTISIWSFCTVFVRDLLAYIWTATARFTAFAPNWEVKLSQMFIPDYIYIYGSPHSHHHAAPQRVHGTGRKRRSIYENTNKLCTGLYCFLLSR